MLSLNDLIIVEVSRNDTIIQGHDWHLDRDHLLIPEALVDQNSFLKI